MKNKSSSNETSSRRSYTVFTRRIFGLLNIIFFLDNFVCKKPITSYVFGFLLFCMTCNARKCSLLCFLINANQRRHSTICSVHDVSKRIDPSQESERKTPTQAPPKKKRGKVERAEKGTAGGYESRSEMKETVA